METINTETVANTVYQYYTGDLPSWIGTVAENDPARLQFEFMRKHLQEVIVLDDGKIVPRAWLAQYPDAEPSMLGIAKAISDEEAWWPEGRAWNDLNEWEKANGFDNRCHVATLSYFATGEGITNRVVALRAKTMGEFILRVAEKVDFYYLQGMDFYDGIPPVSDRPFAVLGSDYVKRVVQSSDGYISIDLMVYENYS